MRVKGEKLNKAALRLVAPVRGDLIITDRPGESVGKLVTIALLVDPNKTGSILLAGLDYAHTPRMSGDSFLVTGRQELWNRKIVNVYQQTWWCRVVRDGPMASAVPARTALLLREALSMIEQIDAGKAPSHHHAPEILDVS